MNKLKYLPIVSVVSGCASGDYSSVSTFNQALRNFHYQEDLLDERYIYGFVDRPFYGDCEDFAFTLQNQIGGEVWYVRLDDPPQAHAVLVKDGVVYDFVEGKPVKVIDYDGRFFFIMRD